MNLKTMILIAVAIGLYSLSHSLEARGDLAPLAASGPSPERAKYHIAALVALLGSLGCFVSALVGVFRRMRA